ncbi:unnamed protein product [Didymodactylos carnosus]|uniref:Kinesin light chain n=1 Tax=Didymodactylos carnosus TaxID=1234261 RepID=A0A814G5M7_9BILA|nr:unnamed protein product [Didymodactylos carnosus]CAF3763917.1 unnamed protein product [Didymodactylos carnosus]
MTLSSLPISPSSTISTSPQAPTSMPENLELFLLVWCDSSLNRDENKTIYEKLRSIINCLRTFDNSDHCEKYIQQVKDEKIVLIVNDRSGRDLIPKIHDLQSVTAIYLYCPSTRTNRQWSMKYKKIVALITQSDELIDNIKKDQRKRNKLETETSTINIFNTSIDKEQKSHTSLNASFMYSQLLTDILLRMKSTLTDKHELINLCKEQYKGNKTELDIVYELDQNYSSDRALWWYTRECFLYRLLNKALRTQNIDLLFSFRFLIRDIHTQLSEQYRLQQHADSISTFYRGQMLTSNELQQMKDNIGSLISMNSFLSTSVNRYQALSFALSSTASDISQIILFEIKARQYPSPIATTKPFANISSISYFENEEETLFMFGSIFRLDNICYDADQCLHTIQLTLCNDEKDHNLKELSQYMKQEMNDENELISIGHILTKMGDLEKSERYFKRLLNELSLSIDDQSLIPHCLRGLGAIADIKADYDLSLGYYQQSLDLFKTLPSNHPDIGRSYNNMGLVYLKNNKSKQGIEYLEKALDILKIALGDSHPNLALIYNNIGTAYIKEQQYQLALENYHKGLDIQRQNLPTNHPDLSMSFSNIGLVHFLTDKYDLALENYQKTLEIQFNSLPPEQPLIGSTYLNIGLVYELQNQNQQALINYQKASAIFHHSLSPSHPHVLQIEEFIQRVNLNK